MCEPPRIIGICGDIGSGKDTVAGALFEDPGLCYTRLAFADRLKQVTADAFPWIPRCHFFGTQAEKSAVLFVENGEAWTGRKLLEKIGQDFRDAFPLVWVRAAMEEIDRKPDTIRWVIPDVRHTNEFRAIWTRGGRVWEVQRVGGPPSEKTGHISDRAWRDMAKDATLVAQHGDLAGLRRSAVRLAYAGGRDEA